MYLKCSKVWSIIIWWHEMVALVFVFVTYDNNFQQQGINGKSLRGPCLHHDDVIKWKHFPLYWSFVRGIHRSPVNSPHKGQWRGALMFSLICVWINGWVNKREAGDLRRYRAHYDVTVLSWYQGTKIQVPMHNNTGIHLRSVFITHATVHIIDFRGVRARYVKRTGQRSSDRNARVKGQQLCDTALFISMYDITMVQP